MFELCETGDWDIFLGPPEQARAETGGADQWALKRRKLPGFAIVNEKKRPHPCDTHYQFSIKTLLTKKNKKNHIVAITAIIIIIAISKYTTNIHIHHLKTTFMCPRSIAGVPFDSVGILQTTLLLRTTCMRSCCNWNASCVAA